jgi:AsmA protein
MSRLMISLTAVAGLIVAVFIALLLLLDNPETYKETLSETFETQTGYGLQINGELNWQYFPPVAIGLSDVAVTIPGLEIPLASLDSANLDLKVWPLIFGGTVEISGLSVDGLTVNATVDSNGKGNWEVTVEELPSDESVPVGAAPTEPSTTQMQIDIGGISVTNITINYTDLSTNSDYLLELASFVTGPLGTGVTTDLTAELRIEDKIANLVISNTLNGRFAINESLDEFLLEELATNTKVEQSGASTLESDLVVNGVINTSAGTADLSGTNVTFAGATFALDLKANDIFGDTRYNGTLKASDFNAKQVLTALDADPGPMANPNALSKVSLSADIDGGLEQLSLTNLQLGLDASNLTGSVELGLGDITSVDFGLTIDQINASNYMASSEPGDASEPIEETSEIVDSELIPVETLKTVDVNGQFSISSLTYDTWLMQNLSLKITNGSGALNVTGDVQAYEGNIGFSLNSNYANSVTTKTDFTVSGVDIAKALELEAMTGTTEVRAAHGWQGAMMSDLTKTLDGDATFQIANGTLDVRPIKSLAAIVDGIQGTPSGIAEWPDIMPFDALNGDHKVNQGLAADQTFTANLENMRITGKGGLDYFANSLAYDIEAELLANVGGQFTVNENLTGVRWPLRCAGSLDQDAASLCLPDRTAITDLIKRMAAEEVKHRGRNAIQEKLDDVVPDEMKDAAKGLLKGLFGN